VEAGARLVDDEEPPLGALAERARELEALRLAARQHRQRLAERQVSETDPAHRLERAAEHVVALLELVHRIEEREGVVDRHGEHVGDVEAAVLDRQDVGLEALALADRAPQRDVGEELHLESSRSPRPSTRRQRPDARIGRPRPTLNEKCAGTSPWRTALGSAAKRARMRSHAVV